MAEALGTRGQASGGGFDVVTQAALPSRGVTSAHLLRHGEVAGHATRALFGQLDVALSDEGRRQERELTRWFAANEAPPTRIYSSDLSRCASLARRLADAYGCAVAHDPRLREQHLGAWQGRTWEEVTRDDLERVRAYWSDYATTRPTGGESLADVAARVAAWWHDVERGGTGDRIVVVTHVGVIRVLLSTWLETPLSSALRWAPATASHTHVLLSDAGAVLQTFGERPWLQTASANGPPRATSPRGSVRIALSGSAGTGKTTLARALARRLDVPYVDEGMRARLEAGLDLHTLTLDGLRDLIEALWDEQHAREQSFARGAVCDRASVDYAAFWLHYALYDDAPRTERFLERMLRHARAYDAIVLLPWGELPLVDDRVRSTNRWLQLRYQGILEHLLERSGARVIRVSGAGPVEQRCASVLAELHGSSVG
jgi:broad specificity phosphatase PhoE/nicotinamide riboside kinase